MKIKPFLVACALVLAPATSAAADAADQLRQFIDTVRSASGEFTQQREQAQSGPQTGTFSFERPGKFRWHVKKPYEQLIVSNGKTVYQYDPDLMQVTERSVDQSIGASPAAILFGSGSLEQAFTLSTLPSAQGVQWLRAKPRSTDAGFAHMDIGFQNGLPVRLLLLDAFGQTTRIDLANVKPNTALDASTFTFTPPRGVDVVKMQ
ncbi:MAG: outer membrane lipoprotein chaperone LolA [Burkholderiaceae bacterium]|jgi:outer membrane lipoprotein carrier protein